MPMGSSQVTHTPGQTYSACRTSRIACGFFDATRNNTLAGPSGFLLPCSQFRKVRTLTPIISANSCCETLSLALTVLISGGSISYTTWCLSSGPDLTGFLDTGNEFVEIFFLHESNSLTITQQFSTLSSRWSLSGQVAALRLPAGYGSRPRGTGPRRHPR